MIRTDGKPTIAWGPEATRLLEESHGVRVVPKKKFAPPAPVVPPVKEGQ